MITNMSTVDRILRIILAAVAITLYLTDVLTGTLGAILTAVAVIFLATSFINYCPLYSVLGIRKWEKPRTAKNAK